MSEGEIHYSAIMSEKYIDKSLEILETFVYDFAKEKVLNSTKLNHFKGHIAFVKSLLKEKDGYTSYHVEYMKSVVTESDRYVSCCFRAI